MNMPNRFSEVSSLVSGISFPQGEQNDPFRLNLLTTKIIPTLNQMDNGEWGLVTKTDQGNKVPCDIMMWKTTGELVDCLTGTGAMWGSFPANTNPAWIWTPVASIPIPIPIPIPPSDINVRFDKLEQMIQVLIDRKESDYVAPIPPNSLGIPVGEIVLKPRP